MTKRAAKSLKVHILDADLDNFDENMETYAEERGERFQQDILFFYFIWGKDANSFACVVVVIVGL